MTAPHQPHAVPPETDELQEDPDALDDSAHPVITRRIPGLNANGYPVPDNFNDPLPDEYTGWTNDD